MVDITSAKFCKVTNMLSAAGIVFVALYRLISYDSRAVNEAVVSLYYLIFALLIVSAELRLRYIRNLFGFLTGQMGRGFFILLCGTLFLSSHFDITVIVGIVIMGVGIVNMGVRCLKGDLLKSGSAYKAPSAQNQQENPGAPKQSPKQSPRKKKTQAQEPPSQQIEGQGPMIRL